MQNRFKKRQGVAVPSSQLAAEGNPTNPVATKPHARSRGLALALATLTLCTLMSANASNAQARYTWLGNKVGQTFQYNRTGHWAPYRAPYHPRTYRAPPSRPSHVNRVPQPSRSGTRFIFD